MRRFWRRRGGAFWPRGGEPWPRVRTLADAKLAFEHYIDWPSSLAELSLKIGALPRSDTLTAKDLEERIVKFVIDAFPESFRDRAPPRVRRDVAD